jgi:hypothetical protein
MAKILKPRDRRPVKAETRPKPESRPAAQPKSSGRDCDR